MAVKKRNTTSKPKVKVQDLRKEAGEAHNYELMLAIRPMLGEDQRLEAQKYIQEALEKLGGKFTQTDVWGKRHLAYEIKGQDEGYYIVYKCEIPKNHTQKFDKYLSMNDDVLRHIIINEKDL
ncbi:MAG: 30S ribosomal protein S6 [Candidatus Dojkabacteria bacterium]